VGNVGLRIWLNLIFVTILLSSIALNIAWGFAGGGDAGGTDIEITIIPNRDRDRDIQSHIMSDEIRSKFSEDVEPGSSYYDEDSGKNVYSIGSTSLNINYTSRNTTNTTNITNITNTTTIKIKIPPSNIINNQVPQKIDNFTIILIILGLIFVSFGYVFGRYLLKRRRQ